MTILLLKLHKVGHKRDIIIIIDHYHPKRTGIINM
jgi:hypothetical protein